MYPSASVLMTNKNPMVKVVFAKKLAGPFAPKTDSFEPLYAPRPMLELFCRSTAITSITTKTIWTISKKLAVILYP